MAKYIDIPIPTRGFSSDFPRDAMPSDTATEWYNLRLDKPGIMQPRGRIKFWTSQEAAGGTSSSTYLYNAIYANINPTDSRQKVLLSYAALANEQVLTTVTTTAAVHVAGTTTAATGIFTTTALPLAPAANLYGIAYYIGAGGQMRQWSGNNVSPDAGKTFTINAGATSGTFSVAPTSGITGNLLIDTNARVVNGVTYTNIAYPLVGGAGTNFTLGVPYGLGIPGWTINAAGASCSVGTLYTMGSAGTGTDPMNGLTGTGANNAAIAVHQERVFFSPKYGVLKWSEATRPSVWPALNNAFIGEDSEPIMALYSTGRELLIFKKFTTWVLLGDSESNYTVRKLSNQFGAISPHCVTEWNGNVIVCGINGIYMISPGLAVSDITSSDTARGVKEYYQPFFGYFGASTDYGELIYADVFDDHLFLTGGDATLVGYLPNQSWALWGNAPGYGMRKFWRPYTVSPGESGIRTTLGNCKGYFDVSLLFDEAVAGDTYEDEYRVNGVDTVTKIPVRATFPSLRLAGGDTFTVNHMFVEHDLLYTDGATTGATTLPTGSRAGTVNGYTMTLYNMPSTTARTVTLEPRYELVTPNPERYYTTEFPSPGTFALRGNLLRLSLSTTSRTYNFCTGRVYRIRVAVETGKPGATDNAVL